MSANSQTKIASINTYLSNLKTSCNLVWKKV